MHPVDNAVYSAERSVATVLRSGRRRKTTKVWRTVGVPPQVTCAV